MPSRTDSPAFPGNTKPLPDPTLDRLFDDDFDPVSFVNASIAPPSLAPTASRNGRLPQLQESSSEIQSLLTKLNAHNIRTSTSLTQLTDEILRSGSRLAYEVEILRGDVNSLYNVITDTLQEDIHKFVKTEDEATQVQSGDTNTATQAPDGDGSMPAGGLPEPPYLSQLRTLQTAKSRLELTIRTFGDAVTWPLPQNDLTSSLISVSAPEFGLDVSSADDSKAREISKALRQQIVDLLDSNKDVEAASKRVEELRDLASVWKGTAEEKARTRFVDSLAKLVDDRRKILDARNASQRPQGDSVHRSSSMPVRGGQGRSTDMSSRGGGASGLFRNLQKLRDEIYLE